MDSIYDIQEYLEEYCNSKSCGEAGCSTCMYLKGKEDGIDIFKDLIIRYIDRAGACNIEDLERLAEIAKEKDILGMSNEIEKGKEIALNIIKQELSNSSDFVYICKDGREIGTDVSMITDWFNEYTNKEAKCYG